MKKTGLFLLIGMMMLGSTMNVSAKVPALHMDEKQTESKSTQTEDLYQVAENDIFALELPKEWVVEYSEYGLSAGKVSLEEIPYMEVSPVTIEGTVDESLEEWKAMVMDQFGERLPAEPDRVRYQVPNSDRVVDGIQFNVSSEDGVDTYTEFLTLEDVDGTYFTYFCTYLSGSYDETHHEDETTYFEFLHAIDTLTLK